MCSVLRRFGLPSMKQTGSTATLPQKQVNLVSDTTEYDRHWFEVWNDLLDVGTMHRMHKVAKRDGMPICDYYTVGWIYVYIVKLWVVLWIKEKLLYNPKKGLRFFDFWSAFDLWFFNKFKKVHVHHIWVCFQKFSFSWRKYFKGTCVFLFFENLLDIKATCG